MSGAPRMGPSSGLRTPGTLWVATCAWTYGHPYVRMPEQFLNGANVIPSFDQVRGQSWMLGGCFCITLHNVRSRQ